MEVNELLTRKNKFEVDITKAVRNLYVDFLRDTGIYVSSIEIDMLQTEEYGFDRVRYFVDGTTVTLDLS